MKIGMKVVGHELVEEKSDDGPYDMLKVKLRGLLGDKKTKCEILMDPGFAADYPLGDKGELVFEIRQQRLDLAKPN